MKTGRRKQSTSETSKICDVLNWAKGKPKKIMVIIDSRLEFHRSASKNCSHVYAGEQNCNFEIRSKPPCSSTVSPNERRGNDDGGSTTPSSTISWPTTSGACLRFRVAKTSRTALNVSWSSFVILTLMNPSALTSASKRRERRCFKSRDTSVESETSPW